MKIRIGAGACQQLLFAGRTGARDADIAEQALAMPPRGCLLAEQVLKDEKCNQTLLANQHLPLLGPTPVSVVG